MCATRETNVLIMVTGSVAAIKVPELVHELIKLNGSETRVAVRVAATERALHFFSSDSLSRSARVYVDSDEWSQWSRMGDDVLHIELRKWATVGIIAPLDANTCAKIGAGICDNLVTCVVRAWDMSKPLLFAPAMNVHMWTHPITDENINKLLSFGYKLIAPIEKKLACGDVGVGAMANVCDIVERIKMLC